MNTFDLAVTCAAGIESVVKKELTGLGFAKPKAFDGTLNVVGTEYDIARLNMFLGSADRVYIKLTEFYADTFDMLFGCVDSFDWIPIIPFNAKIIVNGKTKNSKLFALSSIQSIIKKAIVNALSRHYHKKILPETGEVYRIEFSAKNDIFTLHLNTSGDGLHKRGYRDLVGKAPLRETLAYALLKLSDFSADRPFCDPFCGSGTIVTEGARMAMNIAPGRDRTFDYMRWDFISPDIYRRVKEEADDKEKRDVSLRISGFDIDPKAVSLALRHAERAGVKDKVHIQVQDVADLKSRYKNGCIVTNPPYGERLLDKKQIAALYSVLGEVWQKLDHWSLNVLTAAPSFEKDLGKKADRNRKLFNAELECHFYMYGNNSL